MPVLRRAGGFEPDPWELTLAEAVACVDTLARRSALPHCVVSSTCDHSTKETVIQEPQRTARVTRHAPSIRVHPTPTPLPIAQAPHHLGDGAFCRPHVLPACHVASAPPPPGHAGQLTGRWSPGAAALRVGVVVVARNICKYNFGLITAGSIEGPPAHAPGAAGLASRACLRISTPAPPTRAAEV